MDIVLNHQQQLTQINLNDDLLKDPIKLGKALFNPVLIIQILEEVYNCKFLARRKHKILKRALNIVLELCVLVSHSEYKPCVICGKSEGYIVAPRE